MLVLEGEQGLGKSTVFEILAGSGLANWASSMARIHGKLAGVWIVEIELAGLKKSDETVMFPDGTL